MAHSNPAHELQGQCLAHHDQTQLLIQENWEDRKEENWLMYESKRESPALTTRATILQSLAANSTVWFFPVIHAKLNVSDCHINPHSKTTDLDKVLTIIKTAYRFLNSDSKKVPLNIKVNASVPLENLGVTQSAKNTKLGCIFQTGILFVW